MASDAWRELETVEMLADNYCIIKTNRLFPSSSLGFKDLKVWKAILLHVQ